MYCSNCGARVPEGAEFCAACGSSVREIPAQRPAYPQPQQRRNNNNVIIIALVAVAVVLVAAIICFTILTRGKQQAQMAAIQAEQTAQQAAESAEQAKQEVQEQAEAAAKKIVEENEKSKEEEDEADTSGTTVNNYYYYNTTNHTDDYYSKVKSSGYLWPTDTMYISSSDLSGLGQDTVAAIRNEIYARHGYAFETARWKEYFSQKSWYVRDSSCTESTVNARLSSIEKANVDTIVAYEESMGWR